MSPITSITCDRPGRIEVAGKVFVTTGEFRQDRLALEKSIVALGGILKGHCSRHTDYVIVGERGPSGIWKFRHYGTKLDRAVRLQFAGHRLAIVMEGDFLRAAAVPGRTLKQCVPPADTIAGWNRTPVLAGGIPPFPHRTLFPSQTTDDLGLSPKSGQDSPAWSFPLARITSLLLAPVKLERRHEQELDGR